jgi:hypothetical protein
VWLLIGLNILMAFASIGIFLRMAPAIERINFRNARSLEACEQMLVAMAAVDIAKSDFQSALDLAGGNITEPGELEACQQIQRLFLAIQDGDDFLRQQLAQAIVALADRNRVSMNGAAKRAQSLGRAGAWSVAFMALLFFTTSIIFEQRLRRDILDPVRELDVALQAHRNGDFLRRCTGIGLSKDMKRVFAEVNNLLDQKPKG